jgi:tetratricopeptide (TPR) repeat protein
MKIVVINRPYPYTSVVLLRAPAIRRGHKVRKTVGRASRIKVALLIFYAILTALTAVEKCAAGQANTAQSPVAAHLASITIDYPLDGSIFPPEITPPTFIWHDTAENATRWRIDIAFVNESATIHAGSAGERLALGEVDQRCISSTNELPKLTPEQATAHTWIPAPEVWEAVKLHSVAGDAVVTITGFSSQNTKQATSSGRVTFRTSKNPVGAPIFYRDVPLMPSENDKGVIKPLDPSAIPLIQWRLRDISKLESRVVLHDMPTCANCHSFSRDGTTMGMDMDGPENDKGLYAIVPVKSQMNIDTRDMVNWNPSHDRQISLNRVGFMSQVSPDGKYVITTVNTAERSTQSNYYVINFKDYRFLQVFYPTRGILAWYSRDTGQREPLPGADDPRYVQTDGVWSPDGSYVVFARAESKDPHPANGKMAEHANDPAEVQIQYDLYRVPFNGGQGGQPEVIAGASANGMSNTFPKVSPDGRWIVFVKCRNGQLMRPDSQLYIVPAHGGEARRMRCNTPLMNSWHSFSPNGQWLVFSSKARSPYTQMYLTHIDAQGNDSPAILIDHSTASNRAVNIPEFVNIPPGGIEAINTPAVEMYRKFDHAADLMEKGQSDAAIAEWRELLATNPEDARIHGNLGAALTQAGQYAEAIRELNKALELDPQYREIYHNLARTQLAAGQSDEAILTLEKGLEYYPESADLHDHMGLALTVKGRLDEAQAEFAKSLAINPSDVIAHFSLGQALARKGDWDGAISEYRESLRLGPPSELAHVMIGTALRAKGDLDGAIAEYHEALRLNPKNEDAHVVLGKTLGRKRDWDEAIAEYREALRLNPNDDMAHWELGNALTWKSDWDGAIAEEREALRLNPNLDNAHVLLGAVLGKKHDWEGEIAEEREALRLNPKNGQAHFSLGFALEEKGNRADALQEYRTAYELNPQGRGFREAYERLSHQASQ